MGQLWRICEPIRVRILPEGIQSDSASHDEALPKMGLASHASRHVSRLLRSTWPQCQNNKRWLLGLIGRLV